MSIFILHKCQIVLRRFFLRRGEELFGQREFYGPTVFHEERIIHKAPGLGQVVRDDDDAAGLAQLLQRLLYLQGIADVQRGAGPGAVQSGRGQCRGAAGQKKKGKRNKNVSSEELLPYRQIFDILPYLLKHVFSRGHRILPVTKNRTTSSVPTPVKQPLWPCAASAMSSCRIICCLPIRS